MSVAYVLDEVFADHRPPSAHPERPERLAVVLEALAQVGMAQRGKRVPSRAAREEELGRVHTAAYVGELSMALPGRSGWIDEDTYFSPRTWDAARTAAGAAIDLTERVLDGEFSRALAVVRPPGHHAEADRAMGFCLFNNVALAARAAQAAGAGRVAILDWDVHHGNGTQHSFYGDPAVMYLSVHQFPHYPGTGAPTEVGEGIAAGGTVNVGLPSGCGDDDYLATFDQVFAPALERFQPDIVLVSAGYDAFVNDPLASMEVTAAGYRGLAKRVCRVADAICEGRLVCVLEGGYDLAGLAEGVAGLYEAMEDDARYQRFESVGASAPAADAIEATRVALSSAEGA